jgi:uncharacterized protein (DUF3084 family)
MIDIRSRPDATAILLAIFLTMAVSSSAQNFTSIFLFNDSARNPKVLRLTELRTDGSRQNHI